METRKENPNTLRWEFPLVTLDLTSLGLLLGVAFFGHFQCIPFDGYAHAGLVARFASL